MKNYFKAAILALVFAGLGVALADRNGSGTYVLPAGNPVNAGTPISPTWANNTLADIANNLTDSIAKDGQTVPTANLPMGGFLHTGVANATARNQYAAVGQIQDFGLQKLGSVAGTNTVTGALSPSITAYSNGMLVVFHPANTNSGAVTLAVNGLAALDVQKNDGDALIAGDLVVGIPAVLFLDAGADDWILLNPQSATLSNGVALSDLPRLSQSNVFTRELAGTSYHDFINTSTDTLAAVGIRLQNSANISYLGFTGTTWPGGVWTGGPTGQQLFLGTNSSAAPISIGTNSTERIRIAGDGSAIDLKATTTTVTGFLDANGRADIGNGSSTVLLHSNTGAIGVRGSTTGNANLAYILGQDSTGASAWFVGDGTTGGQHLQLVNATAVGGISLITNATERLFIDSDGSMDFGGTGGSSGQVLTSNGASSSPTWQSAAHVHSAADITSGTLAVARGGTGTTTSTGTGNNVLSASPTLTGTVTAATVNATTLQQGGSGVWTAANDGSGSGLDADLIDGQSVKFAACSLSGTSVSNNIGCNTSTITGDTGRFIISFTVSWSTNPTCTATPTAGPGVISIAISGGGPSIDVSTYSMASVRTQIPYNLICIGT